MNTVITLENGKTFSINHEKDLGLKVGDIVEFELPANNTDVNLEKILKLDGLKIIDTWETIKDMDQINH